MGIFLSLSLENEEGGSTGQDPGKASQEKFVQLLTHRTRNRHRVLATGESLLRDTQQEVAICHPDSASRGFLSAKRLHPWCNQKAAEPADLFLSF